MVEYSQRGQQILLPGQQLPAASRIPAAVYSEPRDDFRKRIIYYQSPWWVPSFLVRFTLWYTQLFIEKKYHDRLEWRVLKPGESLSEQRRRK